MPVLHDVDTSALAVLDEFQRAQRVDQQLLNQTPATRIHWAKHPDKCWAVYGMSEVDGAKLQIVSCDTGEIPHQDMRFIIPPRGAVGPIRWASDTDYCLESPGGSELQFWNCSNAPTDNEQWLVNPDGNGHIHWAKHPSRCLNVPDSMTEEGHKLQVWPCREAISSGGAFAMLPEVDTTISWSMHPSKCLSVAEVKSGAKIQLWGCWDRSSYSRFIVPTDGGQGPIVFADNTSYCLDAFDIASSSKVELYLCGQNRRENQQWIFNASGRGLIQSAQDPSKCLEVPHSNEEKWLSAGSQHWTTVAMQLGKCDSEIAFIVRSAKPELIRWSQQPSKCVSVHSDEIGSHLRVRYCNSSIVKHAKMTFIVPPDGRSGVIAWNGRRTLCLEAPGGPLLVLADCQVLRQLYQQWLINPNKDGQIHLAMQPSKCLTIPPADGVYALGELQVQDCQGALGASTGSRFSVGAIDCQWNEWYMWSACSVTCGVGTKRRFRMVNKETFNGGGKDCPGNTTETRTCGISHMQCVEGSKSFGCRNGVFEVMLLVVSVVAAREHLTTR